MRTPPAPDEGDWETREWSGSAADFHALDLPGERMVWWCRPTARSIILGSSQDADIVDVGAATADGVEVVRRRSGGGLVCIDPDTTVWVDITIPRDDPMWHDDVTRSMVWLGAAWQTLLAPWVSAEVYEGPFAPGEWGRRLCFAGTAPGEVLVPGAGKAVGISQRRGRWGARFQCLLHRTWDPRAWAPYLGDGADRAALLATEIAAIEVESPEDLLSALPLVLPVGPGG